MIAHYPIRLLALTLSSFSLMLMTNSRAVQIQNALSLPRETAAHALVATKKNDEVLRLWPPMIDANARPTTTDFALAPNSGSVLECTPPPAGMVSWWAGDNNALDIRSDNHGSLQKEATFAPGKVAQAFSFDGVDDFVQIADSPALSITGSLTIDAWVLLNSYPTGNNFSAIVSKWSQTGENASHSYFLGISGDGNLRLVVGNASGFWTVMTNGSKTVPLNTFVHVAGVFDSTSQVSRLYINGVEKAADHVPLSSIADNDEPLLIGATDFERFVTTRQFTNGLIDEVEIFNRALAQSEIQAIVVADTAGKCKGVVSAGSRCDQSLWKYVYSPQRFKVVRSCITVRGSVVKTSREKDGDIHIQVKLDSVYRHLLNRFNRTLEDGNLVVELICVHKPEISQADLTCGNFRQKIPVPNVGSPVAITGALVTDLRVPIYNKEKKRNERTHGWREIHPVTTISPF